MNNLTVKLYVFCVTNVRSYICIFITSNNLLNTFIIGWFPCYDIHCYHMVLAGNSVFSNLG